MWLARVILLVLLALPIAFPQVTQIPGQSGNAVSGAGSLTTVNSIPYVSGAGTLTSESGLSWDTVGKTVSIVNSTATAQIFSDGTDTGFRFVTAAADVFFATDASSTAIYNATPDFMAGIPFSIWASQFEVYDYATSTKIFTVASTGRIQIPQTTPATSAEACSAGTITVDANYIYVCTAENTWKRAQLTAF